MQESLSAPFACSLQTELGTSLRRAAAPSGHSAAPEDDRVRRRRTQVHLQDAIPCFNRQFDDWTGHVGASGVDYHVDAAELRDRLLQAATIWSACARSTGTARARRPHEVTCAAVCARSSALRAKSTRSAPACAKATAVARPSPLLAPVTTATWPTSVSASTWAIRIRRAALQAEPPFAS